MGPRGLGVLLRLHANLCIHPPDSPVAVHVVDPYPPGSGRIWRSDQPDCLLMNTVASQITVFPDETVVMQGPLVTGPSLWEWAQEVASAPEDFGVDSACSQEAHRLTGDTYPSRRFYGTYLGWVFRKTVAAASPYMHVVVHRSRAVRLDDSAVPGTTGERFRDTPRQRVPLENGTVLNDLSTVVLTQGHLPVRPDFRERERERFARRHGLIYVPPGSPADADLSMIAPGQPVALVGLGLCFFDYLALLTDGRGGEFVRRNGRLVYHPSGREPVMVAGSRRGIPYHARAVNEKGPHGRHEPLVLTATFAEWLRSARTGAAGLNFRREIWPLIAKEVETVYYARIVEQQASAETMVLFRRRYLTEPWGSKGEAALRREFGIPQGRTWDWRTLAAPYRDRTFTGPADFRHWLLEHLTQDIALASLGNVSGPTKAALDVLRDLRNEVRLTVDHAGLAACSHREDLDRWFTPLNAFLSIGPPIQRIEEVEALVRAGLLEVVGPDAQVDCSDQQGTFTLRSPSVPGSLHTATALIEARLPAPDLRRTADPLLTHLLNTGQCASYEIRDPEGSAYDTGGLQVSARSYRVVLPNGGEHPRRLAFGVPTEGIHWGTAAGARPGVNSVTLADADAVARAVLDRIKQDRAALARPEEGYAPRSSLMPQSPQLATPTISEATTS
ncbi:FAD/NAD(P)-binding protein [Streptomyces sp. NBC_00289]